MGAGNKTFVERVAQPRLAGADPSRAYSLTGLFRLLRAEPEQYALYAAVYFVWGSAMNLSGKLLAIAEFRHWWQVLTCYVLYLVPVSLLVRHKRPAEQYIYGVVALAPIELLGYALGTSIAHSGNIVDAVLGPRNFTLAMCVFFGIIPPIGNWMVSWLDSHLFRQAGATRGAVLADASLGQPAPCPQPTD